MKPKFIKAMTLIALVSLGITGLASCGTQGGNNNGQTEDQKKIVFTPSWEEGDRLLENKTYTLKAAYKENPEEKIVFGSDAPSVFKSEKVGTNTIDFSFSRAGTYTITASLESDSTVYSTLNLQVEQGVVSYRLSVDTNSMASTTFEQGSAFNSEGLKVYKVKFVNDEETNSRQTLGRDDYKLYIDDENGEPTVQLNDNETLKTSGTFTVTVKANDETVGSDTFEIMVASRPTYLSDQFFEGMKNNYNVFLIGEEDEQLGKTQVYPWIVRTENYMMSYDSILMGNDGIGFYKDNNGVVRQFYRDVENSTDEEEKFIAGRELWVDASYDESTGNVTRDKIVDLDYAKGYFKYTDGTDYDSATFGSEGKTTTADGATIFTFKSTDETTKFLTGLVGVTELLNYGFEITPSIVFVEDATLGISALLSIVITMPNGQKTGGSFIIDAGKGGSADIEKFIKSNPQPVEGVDSHLTKALEIVQGNNFVGSDEENFVDGFTDSTDSSYGIYYATNDSYMTSTGYKSSQKTQYSKFGVFTIGEGTTLAPGKYAYSSSTADGSDATAQAIEESKIAIFEQYMPRNWPGFTTADNKSAIVPGYDFASQWLLQALPTTSYKFDDNGNPVEAIGKEYQFRLAGALTATLWAVLSTVSPSYGELFTGDSIILNVGTDMNDNLTSMSIIFHGNVSEKYQEQMQTYSSCNILSMVIDVNSVGKTTNPYVEKYIQSITKVEEQK